MESENWEDIIKTFQQIDIKDEPGSEKYELHCYQPPIFKYEPQQRFPRQLPEYVDFELHVKEKCENKIKILDRQTFHQIKRPILICFHHFREKSSYLTKWLDRIYQLSLNYGDRIEFVVADMYDIDLLYPGRNPLNFYNRFVAVEDQCPYVFTINEKKLIYEHHDAYHSLENLLELCENLLKGKLYPSQPLPRDNDKNLIKICVHANFEELVMNSRKNIFLIINLFEYETNDECYQNVALALKDCNLDIVYMEAEQNYIPFEYCAYSCPTILFIPSDDKHNFIYYEDFRTEENITEFLKNCLEDPEYLQLKQQQQKSSLECKNVKVAPDFSMDLNDLPQFLEKYYDNSLKLIDRELLLKSKDCLLIVFMDFQGKCLTHHVKWFNKLYQVAENCFMDDIFIADFQDIDVIHSKWQAKDLIERSQGQPRIYGFDRLKNIYEFGNFQHPATLFYFTNELLDGELFYSQVYDRNMAKDLVKNWTAYYFKKYLRKLKKHIFITFYSSEDQEKNERLFALLEEIVNDVKGLNVEVVKFDVKFNYLSLEYRQPHYPVHYFIPKNNKRDMRLYLDKNLRSENLEELSQTLNQIDITDEPGSEKYELYDSSSLGSKSKPKQQLPRQHLEYVDFEFYVKEKCENKIKILNRQTFHQIKRPILICFHHFREKCSYLTKWLDRIYQLSLKYGDRIEFIVADMYDTDLLYPGRNPINFYCRMVAMEHQYPNIYVISEQKWVHEHCDAQYTLENLGELCENLLNGKLYPSQPLPPDNDGRLIKICVHDNYEELVLNSEKNIFLIVNSSKYQINDADYENVALALKDYNLDIVYMEAEENYIPFEFLVYCYPTLIFIPFNDKRNFIYYNDFRTEEKMIEFLKKCLEQPEYLQLMQHQHKESLEYRNVKVSPDFSLDFIVLPEFLKKHYGNSLKLFDREMADKSKKYVIIAFMDFQGKCLAHHVQWLNKIYQVAENLYISDIFIADFQDINVIHSKWSAKDLIEKSQGQPRIYVFDRLKNIYEFGNFQHPATLFHYINDVINGDLFCSEVYDRNSASDLVKTWSAYYFKIFLRKCKKHIFITFYSSEDPEKNEQLFALLEDIAKDFQGLNVEVVKFDVKFNYLSLEYQQPQYPVHYFIPKNNKQDMRLYTESNLSRDKMLEFIRNNLKIN